LIAADFITGTARIQCIGHECCPHAFQAIARRDALATKRKPAALRRRGGKKAIDR